MSAVEAWKTQPLRELAKLNYGKDLSAVVDVAGSIPIHGTSESVRWGRGYLYDGASVILGRKGSIDRVKYVEGKFWTIDTAYYLSDFEEALPKWLYYFLSTINLRSLNEATGVPSLSRDRLYMIEVPKPPLSEQAKIAEVLSTVDRGIEQTEALIAKQQRIKTGLMADLLTRGIDEHGNLRSEATHAFKDSPLGRIPVEWEVKRFSEKIDLIHGHQFRDYDFTPSGIAVVKIGQISESGVNLVNCSFVGSNRADNFKRYTLRVGDNLMALTGATLGKVCRVDEKFRQITLLQNYRVGLFREASPNTVDNSFLYFYLQHSSLRNQVFSRVNSGAQGNIGKADFEKTTVALPTVDEQRRIGHTLNLDAAKSEEANEALKKLRSLKTALVQDLLTGKTRVTDLL